MRKIDIFGIKDKVKKEAQELIKSFESMGMALEDGAKDAFIRDRVQRTFELLGLEAPEYSDRVIGFGFVPPASNSSYGRFKSDWGLEYSGMGFVLDDNADDRMRDFKERKRLAGLRIKEASASNPCELIRNFTLRKTPRLTNRYSLKPHQEEGVAWLQTALKKIILEKFDLTVNVVNGDTPTGDKCHNSRQKLIDDFENTKGFNIIIMSPLAAGVGLNVVGANNVIHYSRLWNPAKESQATDRVYRIGQTKDVHVYYPMAIRAQGKCFDETLDYLLKRKQELAEAACYPSQKLDVTNDELVKELLTTETMPSSDKKLY